jgi:hypothetical protein
MGGQYVQEKWARFPGALYLETLKACAEPRSSNYIRPPSLLLPVEYGLFRKILVSARRMTEELRQLLDISGVRNEACLARQS